jgi:prepilin-type N-terminal cleavage/methylation domain-containing protein
MRSLFSFLFQLAPRPAATVAPAESPPSPALRAGRRRGFTIAEVMMAAAVMALAITTSITTMQRAFLAIDVARGTSYAAQIMQSELEKMRLQNWTTVSAYSSSATTVTIDSSFTSNSYIGNRYTLSRTATTVHTGMIKITLTISWRTYDARLLTRSYVTYYGKNGLYDYVSS